jgi:hypothetical protein
MFVHMIHKIYFLYCKITGVRASDVVLVGGKFTSPVLRGRTLRINVWKTASMAYVFQVMDRETGFVVLSDGELG